MKIKSAKSFRFWYKTKIKEIEKNNPVYNENFIGTYHKEIDKKTIKGFFEMYHGDKPDIASYLPSILKIAEDGQAIYEFLQNAVDCGSTHFFIFYNEKYFLAINNGSPFDTEGLQSILNIAQTTKKDPDKIGRFGIGFKLAHRLVGKNEGTNELVNQYKGPILFSWSKLEDLENLLKNEKIEAISPPPKGTNNGYFEAPYLLKLLLTNFPSDPNETVKDLSYKDSILFPREELNELVDFLKENFNLHSDSLEKSVLNKGSMFFIKLGEDKKKLLDKDYSELVNGIQYSMNTLKRLEKVYINNDSIEKTPLHLEEGVIKKGSEEFERISPEYKEFDIKFAIGFNTIKFGDEKSYDQIMLLKEKPNFYKYFPMGDEINGFAFIVHCDSFSNEANRRKLHVDDINGNLFPELANHITEKLFEYKISDPPRFLNLYASLLLSDIPDRQNNKWLRPIFYDKLLASLQKNIPTKSGVSDNAENVKINTLKVNIDLADFGLSHIEWFKWDSKSDNILSDEAKKSKKLGIKEWDIRDVVENADLESINNWIINSDKETYNYFLAELEEIHLRKYTKEKICQIKLFEFSNGQFFSFNEVVKKRVIKNTITSNYSYSNLFFKTHKIEGVTSELNELQIFLSEINISKYSNIFSAIDKIPDEKQMYKFISEKCKTNTLSAEEKKKLFLNFINDTTKFDNVAEGTLKDLQLFCDNKSLIKPLNHLISNINTPSWLDAYKIKKDEYFPELNPYLISDAEDIFKEIYQRNQDDIITELTTAKEIKSLIKLYQDNQMSFFKEFIIRRESNGFVIDEKTNETYQVQSADKEARKFLDENCADNLFVLPYEFLECKEEEGIIKADDLHSLILEFVDVDQHKDILVDIVKYKAKHKFLQELSEFRFNSETEYTKEHYECKIIDLAYSELKENEYQKFKEKVIIETDNQDLKLSEIPPFTDKIKIDEYKISLAKILPDNYENSDHLSSLINQFIGLGLNKERIGNLFGISEEPEPSNIFQMFSEQVETLENAEQLAFVILYNKHIKKIDLKTFKVLTKGGGEYDLTYNFYTKQFNFLVDNATLDDKYKDIKKVFQELPIAISDESQLLDEPYFLEEKFVCPDLITENLNDKQKLSFVEFLFNQWNKKNKKTAIKKIDWSKIDDTETVNILGFNPITSVYPTKYACESEALPDYLIKWIGKEESKIDFLTDLGIWTENSVIVELRKYFRGTIKVFHNNCLTREPRFNENETVLFNSLEWLKEQEITLKNEEQFETFKKVVQVISENRDNNDLILQEEFDFEELEEKSEEWKETENHRILLCEGKMPKVVKLNEVEDYIFYNYNLGDYAINEGTIYLNTTEDRKKILQKMASNEENDFTFEDLWQLFSEQKDETEILKQEIAKLKQQVSKIDGAKLGTEISTDISKNDQKEANREAKENVKLKLENEGFQFTEDIGKYSTINGVFRDDVEHPLVVKSYKYQDEPLKIGAKEWIQLMRPNSMFWAYFGNGNMGCLKLSELLRNQDKLTISFSTENLDKEDRLEKFAELLQYFGNVHFDFNSVKPSDYSVAKDLSDYRFDERSDEEDLSSDDENLL